MNKNISETSQELENSEKSMKFSHLIPKDFLPEDYSNIDLPDFGFELDNFQKQGIYFLNRRESVFIAAHTSSGKTILAHYCILDAIKNNQKVIYTSPIKALSNQKYYEFRNIYSQETEMVGIITGDVQINEDAPILIMTTEILRNRLFKTGIENLGFVIFDEIHYINDKERGVVWEESIIQLKSDICMLFLSATISNPLEFSEWVGRIKNRTINVIKTNKRVIPLKYICFQNNIYTDISGKKIESLNEEEKKPNNLARSTNIQAKKKITRPDNLVKKFSLTLFLQKIRFEYLPTIFFCFSRAKCEDYMNICNSISYVSLVERNKIMKFLDQHKINSEYRKYWMKGIAVHHSGLLPIDKEAVELLFQQNLIKILFATETMAMGLNMPAKSVIFLHPFKKGKLLSTTPFLQMSGRAGRRGLDTEGYVFINTKSCNIEELKRMIYGNPEPLVSTFRLSFNLILTLMKYFIDIPKYVKRSFGELASQRNHTPDTDRLAELEKLVANLNIKDSIYDIVCDIHSINSGDLISEAEWAVDYQGNGGKIENTSADFIFLKENENTDENITIPFIDEIQKTSKKKLAKKECFLVGKGSLTWESAIEFISSFKAGNHKTALKNIRNLKTLEKLKIDLLNLKEEYKYKDLIQKFADSTRKYHFEKELENIHFRLGDENFFFKHEYESRLRFLNDNGYISDGVLTIKGQVASEIRTLNDIIITEMLFENTFDEMTGEMILSLFSSFVCTEREMLKQKSRIKDSQIKYSQVEETNDGSNKKIDLSFLDKLEHFVVKTNLDYELYGISEQILLNFTAVKPVYLWCQGRDLDVSTQNEIAKGSFVRVALRLHESLREIQNICGILQNNTLLEKLNKYESILIRDIICQESLYLKK